MLMLPLGQTRFIGRGNGSWGCTNLNLKFLSLTGQVSQRFGHGSMCFDRELYGRIASSVCMTFCFKSKSRNSWEWFCFWIWLSVILTSKSRVGLSIETEPGSDLQLQMLNHWFQFWNWGLNVSDWLDRILPSSQPTFLQALSQPSRKPLKLPDVVPRPSHLAGIEIMILQCVLMPTLSTSTIGGTWL